MRVDRIVDKDGITYEAVHVSIRVDRADGDWDAPLLTIGHPFAPPTETYLLPSQLRALADLIEVWERDFEQGVFEPVLKEE